MHVFMRVKGKNGLTSLLRLQVFFYYFLTLLMQKQKWTLSFMNNQSVASE